jgi:hypothetical protein
MLVVFSVILVVILFGIYTKENWKVIAFNVLCASIIYYWVNKQKETYVVQYNVKDISTFLF